MVPSHWVPWQKTATKWTKTQFSQGHFVRKPVWIHPQMEGGGGVNVEGGGGGGRLCEILAKWGVGVNPHRGVNPREYGSIKYWGIRYSKHGKVLMFGKV